MKMKLKLGGIAFLVGILGAIILGLLSGLSVVTIGAGLTTTLVIVGLVIGLLNITDKEAVPVMIASIVLGGGSLGIASLPLVGGVLDAVLVTLGTVILPAGLVIAVKTIIVKAK